MDSKLCIHVYHSPSAKLRPTRGESVYVPQKPGPCDVVSLTTKCRCDEPTIHIHTGIGIIYIVTSIQPCYRYRHELYSTTGLSMTIYTIYNIYMYRSNKVIIMTHNHTSFIKYL